LSGGVREGKTGRPWGGGINFVEADAIRAL